MTVIKKAPKHCPVCNEHLPKGGMISMYFGVNGKGFAIHLTNTTGEDVSLCLRTHLTKKDLEERKQKITFDWNQMLAQDWEAVAMGSALMHAGFEAVSDKLKRAKRRRK